MSVRGLEVYNKMSYFASFTFNAVEFQTMAINERLWCFATEVCKALEYGKSNKADDIVKILCSTEKYVHKCQSKKFVSETNLMD